MTKQEIETPALLVDLDRMEANLERMATFKLRPHFKNTSVSLWLIGN